MGEDQPSIVRSKLYDVSIYDRIMQIYPMGEGMAAQPQKWWRGSSDVCSVQLGDVDKEVERRVISEPSLAVEW